MFRNLQISNADHGAINSEVYFPYIKVQEGGIGSIRNYASVPSADERHGDDNRPTADDPGRSEYRYRDSPSRRTGVRPTAMRQH